MLSYENLTVAVVVVVMLMRLMLYDDRLDRSSCRRRRVRASELFRPKEFKTLNDRYYHHL